MKFLSIDIEATGLQQDDQIIEFAALLVEKEQVLKRFHCYVQYSKEPSSWVKENLASLLVKAQEGVTLDVFKKKLEHFLQGEKNLILLGKSLNAIDIPFLKRDLGEEFFYTYFSHRTLDLTSIVLFYIEKGLLPLECSSGAGLQKYFKLNFIAHEAMKDAENNLVLLDLLKKV